MSDNVRVFSQFSKEEAEALRPMPVYYVQLTHNLAGRFPAVRASNNEMVVCTDRAVIEKVWRTLRVRASDVETVQALVDPENKFAFEAGNMNAEQFPIINNDDFDSIMADENDSFKWAPGLLSFKKEPTPEEMDKYITKSIADL
ncbi:MAG: hypothetical protein ACKKL6_01090 [Candidatus Komeilibacteria bacterium]